MAEATTVLERCDVQPSADAAPEMTLPLVHFDIGWLYFHPVHRLLFFDFPCSKSQFLETLVPELKQSLMSTLTYFLPLAGKIIEPLDSRKPFARYVAGDTVPFTIAESDEDFSNLTGNHPRLADDFYCCVPLLPPVEQSTDGVVFPVLALQVTLFPGKGVCLGFTNHHAIGDASSIVRFIKSWASINRLGDDAKIDKPYYDRTAVEHPELDSIYCNLSRSKIIESPAVSFPINRFRATFVLTKDQVQKLKHLVLERRPGIHVTAFTVTCALVWVCLAKAESAADEDPEYVGIAADCRGRLNPAVPAAYFGNCLALVIAESNHGVLKSEEGFMAAAEFIGEAIKKRVYNEKGILDGAENWPLEFVKMAGKRLFGVAGSPRFDLYEVDYGWGRARKFESQSIDWDTSMSLCKSRDEEGGLEIGLSRKKEILDAFSDAFGQTLDNLTGQRCS